MQLHQFALSCVLEQREVPPSSGRLHYAVAQKAWVVFIRAATDDQSQGKKSNRRWISVQKEQQMINLKVRGATDDACQCKKNNRRSISMQEEQHMIDLSAKRATDD